MCKLECSKKMDVRNDELCDIIIGFDDEVEKMKTKRSEDVMRKIMTLRDSNVVVLFPKELEERETHLAKLSAKRTKKVSEFIRTIMPGDNPIEVEIDGDDRLTAKLLVTKSLRDIGIPTSSGVRVLVRHALADMQNILDDLELRGGDATHLGNHDDQTRDAMKARENAIKNLEETKEDINRRTLSLMEELDADIIKMRSNKPPEVEEAIRKFNKIVSDYNLYSAKPCEMCGQKLMMSTSPHHRFDITSHRDALGYACTRMKNQ